MNKRANEITLNDEQFEQLKTMYIHTIVENMNVEELEQYVLNDMEIFMDKLSESGVYNEIEYTLSEETLQEFITTIKEDYKD